MHLFKNASSRMQSHLAQKMKFSIKDFFSKYDQIRSFLRIWSHFLKKSLMENLILCAVLISSTQAPTHVTFICSNSAIKKLEKCVKYVQI